MVFTVGTPDDESDAPSIVSPARSNKAKIHAELPAKLDSDSDGSNGDRVVPGLTDTQEQERGKAIGEDMPDSVPEINTIKASADSEKVAIPALRRQATFTMGSHSEISDADTSDRIDRQSAPASPNFHAAHYVTSDRKAAVGSKDKGPDKGHFFPSQDNSSESVNTTSVYRHQGDQSTVHRLCCDTTDNMSESWNDRKLHLCKATTSLSNLYHAANRSTNDQSDLPDTVTRSRVTSEPSASGAHRMLASGIVDYNNYDFYRVDNTGTASGSDVFAVTGDAPGPRTKGKAFGAKDSHTKLKKKVISKKSHIKKATSASALRSKQRYGNAYRREASNPRVLGPSKATAIDESINSSYVDYSSVDDAGDVDCGADNGNRENSSTTKIKASVKPVTASTRISQVHRGSTSNINPIEQLQASPHSPTTTLSGDDCAEVDDTATTASTNSHNDRQYTSEPRSNAPRDNEQRINTTNSTAPIFTAADYVQVDTERNRHTLPSVEMTSNFVSNITRLKVSNADDGADTSNRNGVAVSLPPTPPTTKNQPRHQEALGKTQIDEALQAHQMHQRIETNEQYNAQQQRKQDQQQTRQPHQQRRPLQKTSQTIHQQSARQNSYAAHSSHQRNEGYHTVATNRSMRSQRQQSMFEDEEEAIEESNCLLTGIKRRVNRPSSMVARVYLDPDTPEYKQQIRKTDRSYAFTREMAHPLLESISRCVSLRDQRAAHNASQVQSGLWSSRRSMNESSNRNVQNDWWASLMPPSYSSSAGNVNRNTSATYNHTGLKAAPSLSAKTKSTELPSWVLLPCDSVCAVYSADMGLDAPQQRPTYEQADPTCPHMRELRARAKELKYARQQALAAQRNHTVLPPRLITTSTAALETWRGRRVPGLLNVEMYTGATVPSDYNPGSGMRHNSDILGTSPESVSGIKGNALASPYRRHGAVYGYATGNYAGIKPRIGGSYTTGSMTSKGQATLLGTRSAAASPWENNPRRSSYFERLSIDEIRPQVPSSAAQGSPAGLLRRVISGLTGGGGDNNSSSYGGL